MEHNANRGYKDSVFNMYMTSNPAYLIESYNAIQGENYDLNTPIEINTLNDVLYKGKVNDLSFSLDNRYIVLYEHQATINKNMPVRVLLYLGRLLEKLLDRKSLYREKQIPLMTPEFIVLYNGQKPYPDISYMRLSDAFISQPHKNEGEPAPSVELVVKVINIGYGHNKSILEKSKPLQDYSIFTYKVQEYKDSGLPLQEAIRRAVIYCRENDIMQPFLTDNSSEVENMLLTDWNWDEAMEVAKEEAREEAREEEAFNIAKKLLAKSFSLDDIIDITGLTAEQIGGIQAGV